MLLFSFESLIEKQRQLREWNITPRRPTLAKNREGRPPSFELGGSFKNRKQKEGTLPLDQGFEFDLAFD